MRKATSVVIVTVVALPLQGACGGGGGCDRNHQNDAQQCGVAVTLDSNSFLTCSPGDLVSAPAQAGPLQSRATLQAELYPVSSDQVTATVPANYASNQVSFTIPADLAPGIYVVKVISSLCTGDVGAFKVNVATGSISKTTTIDIAGFPRVQTVTGTHLPGTQPWNLNVFTPSGQFVMSGGEPTTVFWINSSEIDFELPDGLGPGIYSIQLQEGINKYPSDPSADVITAKVGQLQYSGTFTMSMQGYGPEGGWLSPQSFNAEGEAMSTLRAGNGTSQGNIDVAYTIGGTYTFSASGHVTDPNSHQALTVTGGGSGGLQTSLPELDVTVSPNVSTGKAIIELKLDQLPVTIGNQHGLLDIDTLSSDSIMQALATVSPDLTVAAGSFTKTGTLGTGPYTKTLEWTALTPTNYPYGPPTGVPLGAGQAIRRAAPTAGPVSARHAPHR